MTHDRTQAKLIAGEHCRFCGDTDKPLIKTPCCDQWICCDTAFLSFRGMGDVNTHTNDLVCVIHIIAMGIKNLGILVRSVKNFGTLTITKNIIKIRCQNFR